MSIKIPSFPKNRLYTDLQRESQQLNTGLSGLLFGLCLPNYRKQHYNLAWKCGRLKQAHSVDINQCNVWSSYTCTSARCQLDERQNWGDFTLKVRNREIPERCWNHSSTQIMAHNMLYRVSGWGETPWQFIKDSVCSWNDRATPENKQESNGVIDRIN